MTLEEKAVESICQLSWSINIKVPFFNILVSGRREHQFRIRCVSAEFHGCLLRPLNHHSGQWGRHRHFYLKVSFVFTIICADLALSKGCGCDVFLWQLTITEFLKNCCPYVTARTVHTISKSPLQRSFPRCSALSLTRGLSTLKQQSRGSAAPQFKAVVVRWSLNDWGLLSSACAQPGHLARTHLLSRSHIDDHSQQTSCPMQWLKIVMESVHIKKGSSDSRTLVEENETTVDECLQK